MRAAARKPWILALLLPVLVTSGCISFSGRFGTPIASENLPRIEDGVTTREEIMSWFGPPSAFFNPSLLDVILGAEEELTGPGPNLLDDVYTYRYVETDSTLFFIPILIGIFDAEAVAETLTVFFDDDGRVEYHAYRRDEPGAGRGE